MSETAVDPGFRCARVRVATDAERVARGVAVCASVAVDAAGMREMLRHVPEDLPVEVATDSVGLYVLMLRPVAGG